MGPSCRCPHTHRPSPATPKIFCSISVDPLLLVENPAKIEEASVPPSLSHSCEAYFGTASPIKSMSFAPPPLSHSCKAYFGRSKPSNHEFFGPPSPPCPPLPPSPPLPSNFSASPMQRPHGPFPCPPHRGLPCHCLPSPLHHQGRRFRRRRHLSRALQDCSSVISFSTPLPMENPGSHSKPQTPFSAPRPSFILKTTPLSSPISPPPLSLTLSTAISSSMTSIGMPPSRPSPPSSASMVRSRSAMSSSTTTLAIARAMASSSSAPMQLLARPSKNPRSGSATVQPPASLPPSVLLALRALPPTPLATNSSSVASPTTSISSTSVPSPARTPSMSPPPNLLPPPTVSP